MGKTISTSGNRARLLLISRIYKVIEIAWFKILDEYGCVPTLLDQTMIRTQGLIGTLSGRIEIMVVMAVEFLEADLFYGMRGFMEAVIGYKICVNETP
ncbi:hypothetical protein Tco_1459718 [Tanacetum coccineum]